MAIERESNKEFTKTRDKESLKTIICSRVVATQTSDQAKRHRHCVIRRDKEYLSVFSPNAGKYGTEKTPYLDTFHAVALT